MPKKFLNNIVKSNIGKWGINNQALVEITSSTMLVSGLKIVFDQGVNAGRA